MDVQQECFELVTTSVARPRRRVSVGNVAGSLAATLLLLLPATLGAQTRPPVVKARVAPGAPAVEAGGQAKVAVIAAIESGYHINAHKPTFDYLIPTELKLEAPKRVTVASVSYPKGTPTKFVFSDAPLSVYEGQVVVHALLRVAAAARSGSYPVTGKLSYQACNQQACLAPASVPLSFTVRVSPAGRRSDASH